MKTIETRNSVDFCYKLEKQCTINIGDIITIFMDVIYSKEQKKYPLNGTFQNVKVIAFTPENKIICNFINTNQIILVSQNKEFNKSTDCPIKFFIGRILYEEGINGISDIYEIAMRNGVTLLDEDGNKYRPYSSRMTIKIGSIIDIYKKSNYIDSNILKAEIIYVGCNKIFKDDDYSVIVKEINSNEYYSIKYDFDSFSKGFISTPFIVESNYPKEFVDSMKPLYKKIIDIKDIIITI